MQKQSEHFIALWKEARTRFANQLDEIKEKDLLKKLGDSPNSLGFLIRHIAEVELLFAKNVFGNKDIKVSAQTVIKKEDTGEWTDLEALKSIAEEAYNALNGILEKQTDEDWESTVETQEFGKKTKAEAFGRIVSHTAYHAGQMKIINKYGK